MPRLSGRDRQIVREMHQVRRLLREFGVVLHGYHPGVSGDLKDDPSARGDGYWLEPISFNHTEWQWLKPLLEELRKRRKGELA